MATNLADEARRQALIDQIPMGRNGPPPSGPPPRPISAIEQSELGRNLINTANAIPGMGAIPGAFARGVALGSGLLSRAIGATAPATSLVGRAVEGVAPYAPIAGGAYALNSAANPSPKTPARSLTQAAGVVPGSSASTTQPAAAGAAGDAVSATQEGRQIMPGVYEHGRGQYSDSATGMGMVARAGAPSANSMAAADAVAQRSTTPTAASPLVQAAGIYAPQVLHSGNSWQARNDLRNAEISASALRGEWDMYRDGMIDRRGRPIRGASGVNPNAARYAALLQADNAAKAAEASGNREAMRENAALQREGMQQAGANQRSLWQRAMDQQRIDLDAQKQGFASRDAERRASILERYDAATTDAERSALVNRYPDVFGQKNMRDNFMVVGGGQEFDAQAGVMRNVPQRLIDLRTGQEVSGGPKQLPPMEQNPQAIAIRDNKSLTREQKIEALQRLGY